MSLIVGARLADIDWSFLAGEIALIATSLLFILSAVFDPTFVALALVAGAVLLVDAGWWFFTDEFLLEF